MKMARKRRWRVGFEQGVGEALKAKGHLQKSKEAQFLSLEMVVHDLYQSYNICIYSMKAK